MITGSTLIETSPSVNYYDFLSFKEFEVIKNKFIKNKLILKIT